MFSPGLQMVKDTIYALKKEYGLKILIGNSVSTTNLGTGRKTTTYNTIIIPRAIILPTSMVDTYLKLFNNAKMGLYETDKRTIIVDKKDLKNFSLTQNSFIGYNGSGLNYIDLSNVTWNDIDNYNKANSTDIRRVDVHSFDDSILAVGINVAGINGINI